MIIGRNSNIVVLNSAQWQYLLAINRSMEIFDNIMYQDELSKPLRGVRSRTVEQLLIDGRLDKDARSGYLKIIGWEHPENDFPIPEELLSKEL